SAFAAPALPFVSPIFGDHMVLQRSKTNTIWGWTTPGEKVNVSISNHTTATTAGADGRWQAQFMPPTNAGPHTLHITASRTAEFLDVLVGDVWLCGGQSNMQLPLSRARNGEEEIKAADHPQILFFIVKSQPAYSPAAVVQGTWKICSSK